MLTARARLLLASPPLTPASASVLDAAIGVCGVRLFADPYILLLDAMAVVGPIAAVEAFVLMTGDSHAAGGSQRIRKAFVAVFEQYPDIFLAEVRAALANHSSFHPATEISNHAVSLSFVALICGPDIVSPSEYLPRSGGEDFSFESDGQATEIIELLMRHWNTICSELQKTLHEPNVYLPVLLEREDGVAPANDWAHGFMRGVQMRPASWDELIRDEDRGGPMIPIMMLHHEHDSDPQMRPPPIPAEKREGLLETMIAGLTHIYRYFEPHRRALASIPARVPMRREEPKMGRNEPCPCGSGRKYKHCCMAGSPTFHRSGSTAKEQRNAQIPDDADLPLNASGPACTSQQDRDGILLSYAGEKLGLAIADLHGHARRGQGERDDLRCTMYHLLVAYLGRHNLLGKANDRLSR